MLLKRTLTALILIPLVLLAIFYLHALAFSLVTAAIFLLAAWEMAGLSGSHTRKQRLLYLLWTLITFIILSLLPAILVITASLITWCVMLYYVTHYSTFNRHYTNSPVLRATLGLWLLGAAWVSLVFIHALPHGDAYVLWLLLLVWAADIGAYIVGRGFGEHKLAPDISPGKSIEGVAGGVAASLITAVIIGLTLPERAHVNWLVLIILAVVISLVSVLGDLTESLMKRQSGTKDSGQLLPGHGGLLDRIDSLLAATPCFAGALLIWLYFST